LDRGRAPALAVIVSALSLLVLTAAAAAAASSTYAWQLPPGFPRPVVPADNPMNEAKVVLGRRLFNEPRLSVNGAMSCASCHRRELAYTDGRAQAIGATGERVRRGAMTLTNVAYNVRFTWASSTVGSLEAQMQQPLYNQHPLEMGLSPGGGALLAELGRDESYAQAFLAAFPDDPSPASMSNLIKAIAAYERTLISGRSDFDRYLYDDDHGAMSEAAKRGMGLFFSERIGCAACHSGINFSGPMRYQDHEPKQALFASNALHDENGHGRYPPSDQGLIEVTRQRRDMGKYRIPTLRNVALTAPYMHDGSLPTLEAVLKHYEKAGQNGRQQDVRLRSFRLSELEMDDLLAFLNALTDPQFVTQ
jgi:cytochrome c peroxidase